MKEIQLTQGKAALVDDEDFEYLNQWKWYAHRNGKIFYAERGQRINGSQTTIKMHHVVLSKPPKGFEIDHRNGNGLDNQWYNLRFVTHRKNCQNRKNQNTISWLPGIYRQKDGKKWIAMIQIKGIRKYLGSFMSELEAFNAYKQAVEGLGETVIGH